MAKIKVLLPAMGEGVIEATITQWLKQVGERVEEDDPIVEIATDKVDSEIPSPASGKITRHLFNENDVPKVGDLIAVIEVDTLDGIDESLILTDGSDRQDEKPDEDKDSVKVENPVQLDKNEEPDVETSNFDADKFYSPLVRSIAKEENISPEELEQIKGTGLNDRVTKDDVMDWLNNPEKRTHTQASDKNVGSVVPVENRSAEVPIRSLPGDEIMEMSRMRKLIADHMVISKRVSPHVTSFVEVDVTNIVNWRTRNKSAFMDKHNEKLTYTPIFMEAVLKAIADYPLINVSVSGTKIIVHKQINIGMATALPSGDLIVPVIKQADEKNLVGLARSVNDLAGRARNNKLKPDEIQGSTFTITNVGTFNNITGTPVINQPEVAILALGAIKKKPAVIETPQGDTIGIRHIMILSMSYDHRVVDGALGGMFLNRVGEYLEEFDPDRAL
jgi:2-oxoglutarate dehydrogenase E2 component (dihydrolipoamide succinyltransferase)